MAAAADDGVSLMPYLEQVIQRKMQLDEDEARENVSIMQAVADRMIAAMRAEDVLFNDLYQRVIYTGSYFEGVRVSAATEFDLNLIFCLPFRPCDIEIQPSGRPAYVRYYLKQSVPALLSNHLNWNMYRQLQRFFDESRFLCRDIFKNWIHGIIARAYRSVTFVLPASVSEVTLRESGPAFTLIIKKQGGSGFDVDLVPVIEGPTANWPKGACTSPRLSRLTPQQRSWYLVPKIYKESGAELSPSETKTFWRLSMPEAEKALIHNKGCAKVIIKLLKCLRDEQNWANIASYYLKTLVNLALDEYPSEDYWHSRNKGRLFKTMLIRLQDALKQQWLPQYFYRADNIFSQISEAETSNIAGRIETILRSIDRNPASILEYFRMNG